jgi:outer membrane receptor protein involved in Fe transport
LWNYEAGYKARLFHGLADFSADAFYIKWRDIQALTAVNGFSTIINGGDASSRGFEAEVSVRPVQGLTIGANAAYTDAHLDHDSALIGGLAGDPLPYSAKWSGAIYGDYDFPVTGDWRGFVGGTLRAEGRRNSGFPEGAAAGVPNYVLPSFVTVDLRAGVENGGYRLTLFADNLGNERAQISALTQFETLTGQAEVTMARPRTVGVRLDASF